MVKTCVDVWEEKKKREFGEGLNRYQVQSLVPQHHAPLVLSAFGVITYYSLFIQAVNAQTLRFQVHNTPVSC